MNTNNEYELTADEFALLSEIEAAANAVVRKAEAEANGVLMLILRQQKLEGNWRVSADKTKLLKVEQEA